MGEKQEIGLLLHDVTNKDKPMENSISEVAESYTNILSNQSHEEILNWMRDKDLGKFRFYFRQKNLLL